MPDAQLNQEAFLMMIRACEGTQAADGYRYLFGSTPSHPKLFDDYSTHPNIKSPFKQTDGTMNYSTAAGAYQLLYRIWASLCQRLSVSDFSPQTQDEMALSLIGVDCRALDDVKEGRLQSAIDKCSHIWASLPASTYPQPHRTYAFAEQAFLDAGGTLA